MEVVRDPPSRFSSQPSELSERSIGFFVVDEELFDTFVGLSFFVLFGVEASEVGLSLRLEGLVLSFVEGLGPQLSFKSFW